MPRHPRFRQDGSIAFRSHRTPKLPPSPEALEALEAFTDGLPTDLRAYRDQELLTAQRRYYLEETLRHRTRSLVTVLAGTHDPHNQAAVIRSCESLGIQELHVIHDEVAAFRPSPKVTQNAHRWLDIVSHPDFEATEAILRGRGFALLAASLDPSSATLFEIDFTRPVALIFGSEPSGLPDEMLTACEGTFVIPMYGLSQSLNISVAAAVSLSWAVESRRRAWGEPGDLTEDERMALRRRFYATASRGRTPEVSDTG